MFVFDLFKVFAITVPPTGVTVTAVGAIGGVLSKMTLFPAVIAITCVPTFPVISQKSIVNGTIPSASSSFNI